MKISFMMKPMMPMMSIPTQNLAHAKQLGILQNEPSHSHHFTADHLRGEDAHHATPRPTRMPVAMSGRTEGTTILRMM